MNKPMVLILTIAYTVVIILSCVCNFLNQKEDSIIFLLYAILFRTFLISENKNKWQE